jgi:hypothetical protein
MKTHRARLSLAVLMLALTSTAARAQDTVVAKGDVARAPTFTGLISAIGKTQTAIDSLLTRQTINEADVIPVDTKPLLEGQGEDVLKIQLERNEKQIKQLHEVLSKHPGVKDRLKKESASPDINEIIAAELLVDGKVQLYYRKS